MSNFPIKIPYEKINKRLKLPRNSDEEFVKKIIKDYIPLIESSSRYLKLPIEISDSLVIINKIHSFYSSALSSHLNKCRWVTLMAVTIGGFIEQKNEKYLKNGMSLNAMVGDAVGSETVEESAKYISGIIGGQIRKRGFIATKRFSPGYGDLSLDVQKIFFSELKLNEIGIEINDSFLMTPQKSITAFIGWRSKAD